jgi:hypothetical protein
MRNEALMQQEQQRQVAMTAQQQMTRSADRDQQRVRRDAAQSREVTTAATREIDRRGDNVAEDVRDRFGQELGDAARQCRDTARNVLDQAQEAASAVFRMLEAALQGSEQQDRELTELSNGAARALQGFATEMERQSDALTRVVSEALDEGREHDARESLQQSAEETARLKDSFDQEMRRTNDQFGSLRLDAERQQTRDEERDAGERRAR